MIKPTLRPANPCFSSGPCAKRPGWSPAALSGALLGRSHRSKPGVARLAEVIERSRAILQIPADYRLGIVAGSDTGAVELALWSLLGARGIDLLSWENFGEGWVQDVTRQLKPADLRVLQAPYGQLPDLSAVDPDRDTVFVWNGTTSGVRLPNGDWIAADRRGLTICDATSAAFAMRLPWDKLDVVTWSWQKALGGEAAHGMLALSPRAVERLESYTPPQLEIVDPWFLRLAPDDRFKTVRAMTARLEAEGAGYDLASHRASPPGIRIWTGATVERTDVEALLPWLDWAWEQQREAAKAA